MRGEPPWALCTLRCNSAHVVMCRPVLLQPCQSGPTKRVCRRSTSTLRRVGIDDMHHVVTNACLSHGSLGVCQELPYERAQTYVQYAW